VKVNEIVSEGLFGSIFPGVGRIMDAGRGFKETQAQVDQLTRKWGQLYQNLPAAERSNPTALKTRLDNFLKTTMGSDHTAGLALGGVGAGPIRQYITQAVQASIVANATPPTPPAPVNPSTWDERTQVLTSGDLSKEYYKHPSGGWFQIKPMNRGYPDGSEKANQLDALLDKVLNNGIPGT
jgi:hypothetical protein